MNNKDNIMDALAMLSFLVGVANYNENLTQNDKDDIMKRLDAQTVDILEKLTAALNEQNIMLKEILRRLEK